MLQDPSCRAISKTETPCVALLLRTSSSVSGPCDSRLAKAISRLVYSLLTASTLRPASVKSAMPSQLSPNAFSWLSPVPRVAWSKAAPSDQSGSPQRATTCQLKPSGTVTVSRPLAAMGVKSRGIAAARAGCAPMPPAPSTKAVAPKAALPWRKLRREIARSARRSKSVGMSCRSLRPSASSRETALCAATAWSRMSISGGRMKLCVKACAAALALQVRWRWPTPVTAGSLPQERIPGYPHFSLGASGDSGGAIRQFMLLTEWVTPNWVRFAIALFGARPMTP